MDRLRNALITGVLVLGTSASAVPHNVTKVGDVVIEEITVSRPQQILSPAFRALNVRTRNTGPLWRKYDLVCNWPCAGGLVNSSGGVIETAAMHAPQTERDFTRDTGIACSPIPAQLTITCDVLRKIAPRKFRKIHSLTRTLAVP